MSSKKIYILGIIPIFLILVVFFLLYLIQGDSQKLIGQKKESIVFEQKQKNLENLQERYLTYQKSINKIDDLFVDFALPIEFIGFLENSASDSQALIKVSSTRATAEPEPILFFNISLSGSASNLFKFIDKLENAPYVVELVSLNFKKNTQEQPNNITANLELMVLAK